MSAVSATELEASLRAAVSAERLQRHLEVFAELNRDSGSEDEWQAARYLADVVRQCGVEAEILELDSLISWPLAGTLTLLDSAGRTTESIPVRTRSFGGQTPTGGLEADLVWVPFASPAHGESIFSHRARAGDYTGLDIMGRVVLTADGGPDGIRRAQERGAAGHIHIWPSDERVIHEMIASSVWGTPTTESAQRLPRIPVLGVTHADGERLARMLDDSAVRVRIEANVDTAWRRLPLVTATIPGASPDFLLVGAHIDSWYEGITDNATGDVALLEMVQVLAEQADHLRCGATFAWWPGHSTGRYSGSTWYADTYFRKLRDRALGYLNIDSPGVRESTVWDCRYNTGEVAHVTAAVVRELSGQEPRVVGPLRAADQSFLGIGLPSLGAYRMLPLDHPDRKLVGGSSGAYWWHSPEDTLDKADASILAQDTEVYLTLVARICAPRTIPYDFTATAGEFLAHLSPLQQAAGQHLDLSPTIMAAAAFRNSAERLHAVPIVDATSHNERLKQIGRTVNPALYTIAGPFEMDPALQLPLLPGLAPLAELAALDRHSSSYQFLLTTLRRQRNRIEDALVNASRLADGDRVI